MNDERKKTVKELTIEEIMTEPVFTVNLQQTLKDIIDLFLDKKISGAPVVDQSGHLISLVSETHLMRFAAKEGLDKNLAQFLNQLPTLKEVVIVNRHQKFVDAFKELLIKPINRVIVVDANHKVQGIVSKRNILTTFRAMKD